ncbi:MAG: hypothetical protein ACI9T9_000432 [Oleiphilaceae bacterium]|jgi:hypothetical protein
MKRPIFIMCVLVAIAFVGPMLLKKPDGTAFIESPLDWFSTSTTASQNNELRSTTTQSFYKWKDVDGIWHYSDQPPAVKNIETVTVNTNTNLIQGLRQEKKKEQPVIEKKPPLKVERSPIALPMTVPIEKISKILEDANNIQQLMDNRNKQIEQATLNR